MAFETVPFSFEYRFAARCIARRKTAVGGTAVRSRHAHVSQVRDECSGLLFGETECLHRSTRNAGPDDANDVLIRRRAAELIARKVQSADSVAVHAMTIPTSRLIEPTAFFNLCWGVTVLREKHTGSQQQHTY